MTDDDDLPETSAWAKFEWDCECGYTNTEDHDPSGEMVECDDCGDAYRVTQTR